MLDLFFPRFCLSCARDLLDTRRTWLCARCLARIEPLGADPCPRCAGRLGPGAPASACPDCRRLSPRFDRATAVGRYQGLLPELVTRMKYGREASLAWPLGALLAETIRVWPHGDPPDLVVPVPMSLSRRIRRGFNQAALLAAEVSRRLGLPAEPTRLSRRRGSPAQAGLSRTMRLRAPRGSIRPRRFRRSLAGRRVLLVDDVLTTGATASEAARALKEAGAAEVLVAVVARA